jgi:hypothetical protein
MAIIGERMNANKPPPVADSKSGKLAPGQVNNNKDLDVDPKKEEASFFRSFFSASKAVQKKKGRPVMDAVSSYFLRAFLPLTLTLPTAASCDQASSSSERARDDGDRGDQYVFEPVVSSDSVSIDHLSELLIHSYFNIMK